MSVAPEQDEGCPPTPGKVLKLTLKGCLCSLDISPGAWLAWLLLWALCRIPAEAVRPPSGYLPPRKISQY